MKSLAERLRWVRERRTLNCAEVDRLAGLTVGHCAKLERGGPTGRDAPNATTASKLARALGVEIEWLINGGALPKLKKF